jgi:hypothetical protein
MPSQDWRMHRLAGPRVLSLRELTRLRQRFLTGMRPPRSSLTGRRPWVDVARLNRLVARLGTDSRLDPFELVCALALCSDELAMLLAASSEVGGIRIADHTQGVLAGLEEDYIGLFATPVARTIVRLWALVHDLGKGLCFALKGEAVEQEGYNVAVIEMLLDAIDPAVLGADGCRVVGLMAGHDILGEALRGRFDHRALDRLHKQWPGSLEAQRDALLLVAYLMDATAYGTRREYRDARSRELVPCAGPNELTLSWLFEPGPWGALTLRDPERREILRRLLPNLGDAGSLLAGSGTPAADAVSPSLGWERGRSSSLAWYAVLEVTPVRPFVAVRASLTAFVRRQREGGQQISFLWLIEGRMNRPRRVWLIYAPTQATPWPSGESCERAVREIVDATGWRRVSADEPEPEIMVVLLLPEGDKPALHLPLANLLRHGTKWRTVIVHLVTVAIDAATDTAVWRERLAAIICADDPVARQHVAALAEKMGLELFPVVDFMRGSVYELVLAARRST